MTASGALPARSAQLMVFCAFLFPFELLISVARHKLSIAIGPVGLLLHPAVPFIVACMLQGIGRDNHRALLAVIFLYATGLVLSGIVTGSQPYYVISTVGLGPALIAAMIITINNEELLDKIIEAFVVGTAAWALIFAIWFAYTATNIITMQPNLLDDLSFGRLFLWVRLPGAAAKEFYYFKLLGNYNKQSNILVICLIFSAYLYVKRTWSLRMWTLAIIPISTMLIVMFSRGALSVLALVASCLLISALLRDQKRQQLATAAAMIFVILLSISTSEFRNYWRNTGSVEERMTIMTSGVTADNSSFSSTGGLVLDAQPPLEVHTSPKANVVEPSIALAEKSKCEAQPPERNLAFYIFGYGLGNFGPAFCRLPEGESHTAIYDAWVQGGVLGAIGYVMIFLIGIRVGIGRIFKTAFADTAALYGSAAVLAILGLGIREYSFVYLWVQSAGGFALVIGLLLVLDRPVKNLTP